MSGELRLSSGRLYGITRCCWALSARLGSSAKRARQPARKTVHNHLTASAKRIDRSVFRFRLYSESSTITAPRGLINPVGLGRVTASATRETAVTRMRGLINVKDTLYGTTVEGGANPYGTSLLIVAPFQHRSRLLARVYVSAAPERAQDLDTTAPAHNGGQGAAPVTRFETRCREKTKRLSAHGDALRGTLAREGIGRGA